MKGGELIMCIVYVITNVINGMKYVGVTSHSLDIRLRCHLSKARQGSNYLLHQAIRDYGEDNFIIEPVESNIPKEQALATEAYYIDKFDTYYKSGKGYNMTKGGDGTVAYIFTAEAREKISKANTGRVYSKDRNERLRRINTGRYYKPEWREALSAARMGRFTGSDNPFYGKHHSDNTKLKIREANSGMIVLQIDDTGAVINEFYNLRDAGQWVVNNKLSTAKGTTCAGRIRVVCNNDSCKAYGYRWKYKERSID